MSQVMRNPGRLSVAALAATTLSGCTLIGFTIGAVSDSRKRPQVLEPSRVDAVAPGRKVELQLVDGRLLRGTYMGLEPGEDADYARRWDEAQAALGPAVPLPSLGPGTPVVDASGTVIPGAFEGLDRDAVLVRPPGQAALKRVLLADVVAVGEGERRLGHGALVRLLWEDRLPQRSRIVLVGPSDQRQLVAPAAVSSISVPPTRHGKLNGALIGLAADVLVVAAAAAALNESLDYEPHCPPDEYCGSCPLVYSFDGQRFVLDSEVFGAAIFESAQRTDRAMLDHLAPADGLYRLRLRDEMDEIQWVDAVRLLVVDHPEGTRVVPALDGTLHLLGPGAVAPASVRDLRGHEVGPALVARDELAWRSDALAVAPALRDGLEFELVRPATATTVTLAFRARSTPWADTGKARLMALLGDGLEAWRARMEVDTAARTEFLGALRREGLLTLRAWDGAGWRELTSLANLTTVVDRELAVRVDLAGLPGDRLRFRLDATPGLWTVDSLAAEFEAAPATQVTALAPTSARSTGGRDLRALLAAVDGRRYEMEPLRGEAELTFAAPPPRPGGRRSLALEASGHYVSLSRARGPAQQARFDQLVREPGAFARFNLDLQRAAAAARADLPRAPTAPGATAR